MTLSNFDSILSIDYGERYFGFAIKLKNELTTFPLDVLDSKDDDVYKHILKYIQKYDVDKIIVGYPIGLTGHKTRMTNLVDKFINNVKDIFHVNVIPIDERFTSKMLIKNKTERLDSMSAMLLLETYLIDNE